MKYDDWHVYAAGIVAASICGPKGAARREVVQAANALFPTGISHGWTISKDKTFKGGEPNPCVCESDSSKKHWLLEC